MEFTTETIFEALKSTLGVIDNEERRRQIEAYLDAARIPLERAVFDLLSQLAETANREVGTHYEVSLNYRSGVLDLHVRAREPSEPADEAWSMAEGEVEKITLRIPAELKDLATEAAAKAGLSVNSWFVRMLARALRRVEEPDIESDEPHGRHGPHGRRGRRLSGWVGPE